MERLNTEVLIIGRSGVGKSSLLNYLFGAEREKTGVGEPVTPVGIYRHEYRYDDAFTIGINDSWGLEPDKAKAWWELVKKEMENHDKQDISHWFNTVIYCLNAKSDIVHDFEIDQINNLTQEKVNIVVVFTNCSQQNPDGEYQTHKLTKRILKNTELTEDSIVYVNNIHEKTLGGAENFPFGKSDVFRAVIQNLWSTLRDKVPYKIRKDALAKLYQQEEELYQKIEKNISRPSFFKSEKFYERFGEEIEKKIVDFSDHLGKWIGQEFQNAIDYYNRLSKKYAEISCLDTLDLDLNAIQWTVSDVFRDEVDIMMKKLDQNKSVVGETWRKIVYDEVTRENIRKILQDIKKYTATKKQIEKELRRKIRKIISSTDAFVKKEIEKIHGELQKLNVEELFEIQAEKLADMEE